MDSGIDSHVCHFVSIPNLKQHGCRTYELDDYFYAIHIHIHVGVLALLESPAGDSRQSVCINGCHIAVLSDYCGKVLLRFQLLWLCRPSNDLLGSYLISFISVIQHELEICKLDSPLLFRHIFGTQRIYQLRLQVPENRDGVGCAHLEFHRLLPAVHAVVISQHVYSDENPVHEEVYIVASIFCLLRDIDRQNS